MIELTSAPSADEPPEMVDLFSVDGVMYQIPAKPRVNIALQYLDDMRRSGPVLADMMLLEKLLGDKGYRALCDFPDLSPENLKAVTDVAVNLTLGRLEESPNGGSGSPR